MSPETTPDFVKGNRSELRIWLYNDNFKFKKIEFTEKKNVKF